jgi:murein DD-endopeptidase MepM/ murein hydrolase activator NlpD
MDFHFRDEPRQNVNYRNNHLEETNSRAILNFISNYLTIRGRQSLILSNLLTQFIGLIISEIKNLIVRNMYWGRTSFYRTAFHFLVIAVTLTSLYTGLGSRIISSQRDSLENISVNSRTFIDIDLVAQQGSLKPLEEISEDSDSVYSDYVVQQGDSLQKIAETNGINIDTLRWANNIPSGRDTLKVGQTIKIPKMNGVLHVVAKGETVDKILSKVKLQDATDKYTFLELNAKYLDASGNPIEGTTVFIPEATIPKPKPTTSTSSGSRYVSQPTPPSSVPAGTFVNPMQLTRYSFSRGYSYGHTGVDLAASPGSWIVSAGNGTVSRASWCHSLGYCVVIKHANGYSTLYGHGNGVFAVGAGQGVVAGQKIMQVGCTGRCYGPHLHFSLAAHGNNVYSCYRCRINPRGIVPY